MKTGDTTDLRNTNGQEMSAETKSRLCDEKRVGLKQFEEEAPKIVGLINIGEKAINRIESFTPEEIDIQLAFWVRKAEHLKRGLAEFNSNTLRDELEEARKWMDFFTKLKNKEFYNKDEIINSPFYREIVSSLNKRKERQTFIANQIFLLRDSIKSLGCDCLQTTGGVAQKSIDLPCKNPDEVTDDKKNVSQSTQKWAGTWLDDSNRTVYTFQNDGGTLSGLYRYDFPGAYHKNARGNGTLSNCRVKNSMPDCPTCDEEEAVCDWSGSHQDDDKSLTMTGIFKLKRTRNNIEGGYFTVKDGKEHYEGAIRLTRPKN